MQQVFKFLDISAEFDLTPQSKKCDQQKMKMKEKKQFRHKNALFWQKSRLNTIETCYKKCLTCPNMTIKHETLLKVYFLVSC